MYIQVFSESVGKAIKLTGGPEAEETSKFILMFDQFFDVFNVSNFTNWARQRKQFRYPYRSKEDSRLDVSVDYTCMPTSFNLTVA